MDKVRFAVVSDIHGNYEALIKAMSIIKKRNVEKIICLGDIIGYGPDPNECLEYVKRNMDVVLCGNHDVYQVRRPESIGELCKISTEWTTKKIDSKWVDYIKILPVSYSWNRFGFCHTAIKIENNWPYLNDVNDILSSFADKERVCFYGHTHRPRITLIENDKLIKDRYITQTYSFTIDLERQKVFVNPGSIGQQRDNKTDLSFAICEQNRNILRVDIERHRYCSLKTYIKIKNRGCGGDVADYLIREYSKKKIYRFLV